MEEDCGALSPALEQVRELLYPELRPEEGRARLRGAIAGAADPVRWRRIEALVKEPDLLADLLRRLQGAAATR